MQIFPFFPVQLNIIKIDSRVISVWAAYNTIQCKYTFNYTIAYYYWRPFSYLGSTIDFEEGIFRGKFEKPDEFCRKLFTDALPPMRAIMMIETVKVF